MSLDPYIPNLLTVKDAFPSVQEVLAVEGYKRQNRLIAMSHAEEEQQKKERAARVRGILEGGGASNAFAPMPGAQQPQQPQNAFAPQAQPAQGPLRPKVVGGANLAGYATDPNHFNAVSSIYQTTKGIRSPEDADQYIQSTTPGSPITGKMIFDSAAKTGTDPGLMLALFQHESRFGTAGKAARTMNPGNVGNDDTGHLAYKSDWGNGVDAAASWLAKHKAGGPGTFSQAGSNLLQQQQPPQAQNALFTQPQGQQGAQPQNALAPQDYSKMGTDELLLKGAEWEGRMEAQKIQQQQAMQQWKMIEAPLEAGFKEAMASGDQKTLTAFLDNMERTVGRMPMLQPILAPIIQTYRGLKLTGPNQVSGTIKMSPQLYQQYAGQAASPQIAETLRQASESNQTVDFQMDRGKIVAVKPLAVEAKNQTAEQLARQVAKEKLTARGENREPTAQEVQNELIDYNARSSEARTSANEQAKVGLVNEEAVRFEVERTKTTGKEPSSSRDKYFMARYRQELKKDLDALGTTAGDLATRENVRKSLSVSLDNQEKSIGMMGGFVRNINKQVSRLEEIGNDLVSRAGVRAVDYPLRELKTRFVGSPNESIIASYTTEISNEIGKLSTGSQASVRELSESAQEKWAKIHDPNLSMKELAQILEETRQQANIRLESAAEERDATRENLRGIGSDGGKPSAKPTEAKPDAKGGGAITAETWDEYLVAVKKMYPDKKYDESTIEMLKKRFLDEKRQQAGGK